MENLAFESESNLQEKKWQEDCERVRKKVLKLFSLMKHDEQWFGFVNNLMNELEIGKNERVNFAAHHLLIGSTPDFQKTPKFDTTDGSIEKAIDREIEKLEELKVE